MRAHNPTRRNRNIGTAKSGRGQDNRMKVPEVAHGKNCFWERIGDARQVIRSISGRQIKFFVQPTRTECVHPCTIDDLCRLLSYLPTADWEGIDAMLLRQPRKKEETLSSVWGRLAYAADFVDRRGNVLYSGPAIVIEAIDPTKLIKFGKNLTPDALAEIERLKSDGHDVRFDGRNYTIRPTLESCRATQLYRTLPHEAGHWVDFLEKVTRPVAKIFDDSLETYLALSDRFNARPTREKEQFANAYAEQLRVRLTANQLIPFARQMDSERLLEDDLLLQDFDATLTS
jgi:hypothetical protein